MKELVLIYELSQIEEVAQYVRASGEPPRVVACNFWIERELRQRGIECESFSKWTLTDDERAQWLKTAGNIAREWYRLPELAFFTEQGIQLGEATEPAVESYLQVLLYYFVPLKRMFETEENISRVVVPNKSGIIMTTAGSFAAFEMSSVVDVVHFLAAKYKYEVKELGARPTGAVIAFPPQSNIIRLLRVWNFLIRFFAPHRPLRLFASENWHHIEPFFEDMHDAELVLMDRREVRGIPWRQLWKHRMRFIHPIDVQTPSLREHSSERQLVFKEEWRHAREVVARMPQFTHEGVSWWPLVMPALDFFVEQYAERLVYDVGALAAIYRREQIQKVVLRASVSGRQPHFFIAAKVAASLGIPSIELQHAGAVLDPHSVHSRMEASYLAGYGPLTREIYHKNHQYKPDRFKATGSPRFDRYLSTPPLTEEERARSLRQIGLDPMRPVVMVTVPADLIGFLPHVFDSFENAGLFSSMAELQKELPEIQILFKFRRGNCTSMHRAYIAELFGSGGYAIVDDDLYSRIQISDVVLSGNSTAMYETMIAHKPLVLYPWKKTDVYALPVYTRAAPLALEDTELAILVKRVLNDVSYRHEIIEQGSTFLKDGYAFDGHASERMRALLRENLPV